MFLARSPASRVRETTEELQVYIHKLLKNDLFIFKHDLASLVWSFYNEPAESKEIRLILNSIINKLQQIGKGLLETRLILLLETKN